MSANTTPKASIKTPMTTSDAARIQSSAAKNNRGKVSKGSFASRASRSASKKSK